MHCTFSTFAFQANGSRGAQWSFFLFRSIPFLYVCWFRFGFSHKPKSMRPDRRPLFFFSRPRPNVSRLRRPGVTRAQPWTYHFMILCKRKHYLTFCSESLQSMKQLLSFYMTLYTLTSVCIFSILSNILFLR